MSRTGGSCERVRAARLILRPLQQLRHLAHIDGDAPRLVASESLHARLILGLSWYVPQVLPIATSRKDAKRQHDETGKRVNLVIVFVALTVMQLADSRPAVGTGSGFHHRHLLAFASVCGGSKIAPSLVWGA